MRVTTEGVSRLSGGRSVPGEARHGGAVGLPIRTPAASFSPLATRPVVNSVIHPREPVAQIRGFARSPQLIVGRARSSRIRGAWPRNAPYFHVGRPCGPACDPAQRPRLAAVYATAPSPEFRNDPLWASGEYGLIRPGVAAGAGPGRAWRGRGFRLGPHSPRVPGELGFHPAMARLTRTRSGDARDCGINASRQPSLTKSRSATIRKLFAYAAARDQNRLIPAASATANVTPA